MGKTQLVGLGAWKKQIEERRKKKMKSSKLLVYHFQGKNIVVTRTYSYF